jgi:phosphate:Na+ symporter
MTISAGQMTIELLGGLALFLFGIDQLTSGALTGAFVTAVIQSSSVTTVLVVGFTTAGLMSFSQSIGVIMGANIGTTISSWAPISARLSRPRSSPSK